MTGRYKLWTMKDASRETGIPAASFERAAREHGLLIRMGRAVRFDPDNLKELIQACKCEPRQRDSTSYSINRVQPPAGPSSSERALQTAQMLKELGRQKRRKAVD